MRSKEPRPTDCVVFRYPDGEREYRFAERLPIEGGTISRNGSKYVVVDVHPEEAGTVVTLGLLIESSADGST
jgi:hypothetical protein